MFIEYRLISGPEMTFDLVLQVKGAEQNKAPEVVVRES